MRTSKHDVERFFEFENGKISEVADDLNDHENFNRALARVDSALESIEAPTNGGTNWGFLLDDFYSLDNRNDPLSLVPTPQKRSGQKTLDVILSNLSRESAIVKIADDLKIRYTDDVICALALVVAFVKNEAQADNNEPKPPKQLAEFEWVVNDLFPLLEPAQEVEKWVLKRETFWTPRLKTGSILTKRDLLRIAKLNLPRIKTAYGTTTRNSRGQDVFKEAEVSESRLELAILQVDKITRDALLSKMENEIRFDADSEFTELDRDGIPRAVAEIYKRVFRKHWEINAKSKIEHKLNKIILWQIMFQIKKSAFRTLTEQQATERIFASLMSTKGNLGKGVFVRSFLSPFIGARSVALGVDAKRIFQDDFSGGIFDSNVCVQLDEMSLDEDEHSISRFKDSVTKWTFDARLMHSEVIESFTQRSTFIATLNYSLSTIFGSSSDDDGVTRRVWQFEFLADPVKWEKNAEGVPDDLDITKLPWVEYWRGIDENSNAMPKYQFRELQQKIRDKQSKTLNANWLDAIIETTGLLPIVNDGGEIVAIKRSKLHTFILKKLRAEHLVGDRIREPWVRSRLDKYFSANEFLTGVSKRGHNRVVIVPKKPLDVELQKTNFQVSGEIELVDGDILSIAEPKKLKIGG